MKKWYDMTKKQFDVDIVCPCVDCWFVNDLVTSIAAAK